MNNNPVRAVIWDMDGVIADTALPHFRSWQFAFEKQKVKFTEEDFQQVFGQRNDTIVRKMMGGDVSQEKIDSISQDKEEFFRAEVRQNVKPFPGVISLLKVLQENGISAAIGSSAPLENVQVILEKLKITGYFQAIVYGLEVKEGKPSPMVFQLAARKLGAEPRKCVVIEDAIAGVEAAKRGGMRCIAVTNSHPAEALAKADLVVESLEKVGIKEIKALLGEA